MIRAFAISIFAGFLLFPASASAHAFGQQYVLPLPVSFYVIGAIIALIASFAIFSFLPVRAEPQEKRGIAYAGPWVRRTNLALKALALFFFCFTIVCGVFGTNSYTLNPAPTFFWIIFLLGFAYLSALIGGIWEEANPMKTIASWVLGKEHAGITRYPPRLGYFPALLGFIGLIWAELLSGGFAALPHTIGYGLEIYLLVMLAGSFLFGIETWFARADLFTVFFGLIGKCAPFAISAKEFVLRTPFAPLSREKVGSLSLLGFIIFMLSSTAFDGLHETTAWRTLVDAAGLDALSGTLVSTIGLLAVFAAFAGCYALAVFLMHLLSRKTAGFFPLLMAFGYSLIPIAIAYHIAHYFTLLLINGQLAIRHISDPLEQGWNLFGTKGFKVNAGIIGADTVWNIQLGAIVLGHIGATYVAHRAAESAFATRKAAILSQIPMLALMVGYTALGLWILSRTFATGA